MHVVLISACEKHALKRSRALLDSYALRAGERTWTSAMTLEGLQELRAALKRTASRQTAVACYRNEGMRRMKLLWVVGSARHFGPHGHFPAGVTRRKISAVPAWVRHAALLASAAGQGHDVGKASIAFQCKLRDAATPQKDSIRHEWISLKVIQALREGADWETAWQRLENRKARESISFSADGLRDVFDAFDFLVVSHHGLLGPKKASDGAMNCTNHVRQDPPFDPAQYQPRAPLPAAALALLHKKLQRLEKIVPSEGVAAPLYWRALSLVARAGLIFADHYISSLSKPKPAELYANTKQKPDKTGRALDQPLDQHLSGVSGMAGRMTYRLAALRLPGLSSEAVERIMARTENPLFAWQDQAAAALETVRRTSQQPALVLNLAGTGTGKTRMNAKCACALAGERPVRFATALNLRTLTLQTGDAYREQLGIGPDELACVIGDAIATRLHESAKRQEAAEFTGEDENPIDAGFESAGGTFFMPAWIEPFTEKKRHMRPVIGAPVLASTVDFLIAAGEPHRQGHHVLALLRLVDSDLILDEIDSYGPKAMVAVLRLVQMAGLFGRNVISSSATLARPVANALCRAYRSGAAMRAALEGQAEPDFLCALIDDCLAPDVFACREPAEFTARYDARIVRLLAAMEGQALRIPRLATIAKPTAWHEAIAREVAQLHEDNAWPFARTGKRISFGLVRIANIRPAIETARFLADRFPNAQIACYHAQDFTIRRFLKEKRLDHLLTRKNGSDHIEADADIRERVARTGAPDVPFIVVATPVEEIGRDHDFDWAVIEPSSTQSIVQTAGRVNRHRRLLRTAPNVAILQYNFRKVRGKRIVFTRPGLETEEWRYTAKGRGPDNRNHDLKRLIDWSQLSVLDAGLRFRDHPFACLDDESLTRILEMPLKILCLETRPRDWMVEATYAEYPLRDRKDAQQTWRFNYEEDVFELFAPSPSGDRFIPRLDLVAQKQEIPANAWLSWSNVELAEQATVAEIALEDAFRFTVSGHELDVRGFEWDEAFGASRPFNKG